MPSIQLYKIYKKNRLEWDDPASSSIYYIPITQEDKTLSGFRFVLTVDNNKSIGFLSPALVYEDAVFFLDRFTIIESKDQALSLLFLIESSLTEQVNDANAARLKLLTFANEAKPILQKLAGSL